MIRHGEKPQNPDEHGLSSDGVKRAQCLRHVFGQGSEYDIGHIMAPHVKKSMFVAGLDSKLIPHINEPRGTLNFTDMADKMFSVYRWRAWTFV